MNSPPLTPVFEDRRDVPAQQQQQQPSRDSCDRRRPQEEDNSRLVKMPSYLVGKTVSPFLKEHIPGLYAPVGKSKPDEPSSTAVVYPPTKDSSKFCYRHRPDSKCRRAADETKMGFIQSVSPTPIMNSKTLPRTDRPSRN